MRVRPRLRPDRGTGPSRAATERTPPAAGLPSAAPPPAGRARTAVESTPVAAGRPRAAALDDAVLLRAAAAGDDEAFAVFFRRHLPGVTAFHLRRTRRPELALDLGAETFAAVVVGLDAFDPERGPATAWLYGIAANKLRESLRRGRVEDRARRELDLDPLTLEDPGFARVDAQVTAADQEALAAALADLPAEQRDAVLARVVEERPYEELARELSCSTSVVRQRVHRGLRRMRTQMEDPT